MPYKSIYWIKLEKRLLNDYRFYTLSEEAQLIYLKLLMLAAETNNKIPKNNAIIKTALRCNQSENKVEECLKEIKSNFYKFKENKGFYHFREWGNRCNRVEPEETPRKSHGTPGGHTRIEYNRVDNNKIEEILSDLNLVLGTSYKPTTPKTRELINTRINEGFGLDDFKVVHRNMHKTWGEDEKMCKYLRPITLYGNKFEGYLNIKLTKEQSVSKRIERDPNCKKCKGTGFIMNTDNSIKGKCDCRKG